MNKTINTSIIIASILALSACNSIPSIPEVIQKNQWEGKPIDAAIAKWGNPLIAKNINNETTDYIWDFSRTKSITYESDSYAYYNTDRPGMTTGIVYDTKKCNHEMQTNTSNKQPIKTNHKLYT